MDAESIDGCDLGAVARLADPLQGVEVAVEVAVVLVEHLGCLSVPRLGFGFEGPGITV